MIDHIIECSHEPLLPLKDVYRKPDGTKYMLPEGAKIAWIDFNGDRETKSFRLIFSSNKNTLNEKVVIQDSAITIGNRVFHIREIGLINPAEKEYYFANIEFANIEKRPPFDDTIRVIFS